MLMKKKFLNKYNSEKKIIDKFFKILNFKKQGTFNFENDAAYLNTYKKNKLVITTDTIIENLDFFENDPPDSIAQKIICVNLSDLSSMGSIPIGYTLNLTINSKIDYIWLKKFTNKLYHLQKKYNFYLLGGDLSKSTDVSLSATFFGKVKSNYILSQDKSSIGDEIWVTGNLGDSYIGYKILNNLNLKLDSKNKKYFINSYLYPKPCMFGYIASKYISSSIDISDGFYGDLKKLLKDNYGAMIHQKKIPISKKLLNLIQNNNFNKTIIDILSWGDDYELIFTANVKYRHKIIKLANLNKIKLTSVGSIIKKTGIYDDSLKTIKNIRSFDHFS